MLMLWIPYEDSIIFLKVIIIYYVLLVPVLRKPFPRGGETWRDSKGEEMMILILNDGVSFRER